MQVRYGTRCKQNTSTVISALWELSAFIDKGSLKGNRLGTSLWSDRLHVRKWLRLMDDGTMIYIMLKYWPGHADKFTV